MNRNELNKIINQVKKYDLTEVFYSPEKFDEWLLRLNNKQIKNFISLSVEPSSIMFPKNLLINENLLNCHDYSKRIEAMAKLKIEEGRWHLFDRLCSLNFLKSKNYYQDMEILSKATTVKYALYVIDDDDFIKSKYHNEDLKLIIEATNMKGNDNDKRDYCLVAESLATIASDKNSINSPYHQKDMELIANSDSECLQSRYSYPEHSLNNLAMNSASLQDEYHLENMQILAKNPIASRQLYKIMTNRKIIKGKYYREEVEALVNAKSKITAVAIYYHITCPQEVHNNDYFDEKEQLDYVLEDLYDCDLDALDLSFINRRMCIRGGSTSKYLKDLKLLNKVDDKFVMFIEALISNSYLLNSPYQEYDLNLLLTVTDKNLFMDLYCLMTDNTSLSGRYHKQDVELIYKTSNKRIRNLLLIKATTIESLNSINHEYDMQYISKLDLDNIDEEVYEEMRYYLLTPSGINHIEHIDRLEKLYRGEKIEEHDIILEHLNDLENNPTLNIEKERGKRRILSRVKGIFAKNQNYK